MRLGVNIDHVATLRQARGTTYPDPSEAAKVVEQAGADGLTLHLREDRRHIQDADVLAIKSAIEIPMNLEMAATESMVAFALDVQPEYVCLVPEKREELTTEGGLDVVGQQPWIAEVCARLKNAGIKVSLFIDPDFKQIEAAVAVEAPIIELHTGAYADAVTPSAQASKLAEITEAATKAHQLGLQVNAGHGLTVENVGAIARIPEIVELNIGHAIVARAVFLGLNQAVKAMRDAMREARA